MQFQVPQFIEVEDKIVGPLSIKQFIFLCGAAGACAMLYFLLDSFIIWLIIATPVIALGVAVAFIKINGQPFLVMTLSAIRFYWQPQTYVWQPERSGGTKSEVAAASGFSLESLVSGIALKSARERVQTGSAPSAAGESFKRSIENTKERYQVVGQISGGRKIAKRIDYR